MASVERRERNGQSRYLVRWRNRDGHQQSKSFEVEADAEAFRAVIEKRQTERPVRKRKITASDLEDLANRVVSSYFKPEEVERHYQIGKYCVTYAWPDVQMILEIGGVHRRGKVPDSPIALREAIRDAWLRSRGWLVLRVDDRSGINSMLDQVTKVCRLVRKLRTSSEDQQPSS
jgi:very-short-patch-repair endonuclease